LGKFLGFVGPAPNEELKGELSQRTGLNVATGAEACKASPALQYVHKYLIIIRKYSYIHMYMHTVKDLQSHKGQYVA
jgi:hypothetical protein